MASQALTQTGWAGNRPPPAGGGGGGGGDDAVLMLPTVDLVMAVAGLRGLHDVCDAVLDKLYDITEEDCQVALEKTFKKGAELIRQLGDKLKEHYLEFRAVQDAHEAAEKVKEAKGRLRRQIPEGANKLPDGGWWTIEDEKEDGEEEEEEEGPDLERGMMLSATKEEQEEAHIKAFRDTHLSVLGVLRDVEAACVEFSEEETEELAEVGLFCARMMMEYAQGLTRRSLRVLERDYDWQAAQEKQREREERLLVEEATEEEIAALYRSRGEEPPPPSSTTNSSTTTTTAQTNESPYVDPTRLRPLAPPPASGRHRRGRGAPSRLLWHPLGPALLQSLLATPQQFQAHPYRTTGACAALLPVSGVVVLCLPGVLMTDAVLQAIYRRVGPGVEVWVHDGKEVCRLTWMVSRLSLRQTYRFARKLLRRAGADPVMAVNAVGEVVYEAATHPLKTAGMVWGQATAAVVAAGSVVGWAKRQVFET